MFCISTVHSLHNDFMIYWLAFVPSQHLFLTDSRMLLGARCHCSKLMQNLMCKRWKQIFSFSSSCEKVGRWVGNNIFKEYTPLVPGSDCSVFMGSAPQRPLMSQHAQARQLYLPPLLLSVHLCTRLSYLYGLTNLP